MGLDVDISLVVSAVLNKTGDLGADRRVGVDWKQLLLLTDDASPGENGADLLWYDTRTLALNTSEDLDLAGSLTDALGDPVVFARVKVIAVKASEDNVGNLQFGGAPANAWFAWAADATDKVLLLPGDSFVKATNNATGYAVTAGTGDLLRITNPSLTDPVTYEIMLIGASA